MHPFYSYSEKFLGSAGSEWIGLLSMSMYLVFWGVVIVFAYRFVKKYIVGSGGFKSNDSAMTILRERYARGEIDSEEYHRIKDDLNSAQKEKGSL